MRGSVAAAAAMAMLAWWALAPAQDVPATASAPAVAASAPAPEPLPVPGSGPMAAPASGPATRPAVSAGSAVCRQAEQLVAKALSSNPVDEKLLRAVLLQAALVEVGYVAEGERGFTMTGVATAKADPDAQAVRLARQQGSDVPEEWIDILKAPLAKRPKVMVRLLLAVPKGLLAELGPALGQADADVRTGLLKLSEKFPFMTNARDWGEVAGPGLRPATADGLGLWLAHSSGSGKGATSATPVPEGEEFSVEAYLTPPQKVVGARDNFPVLPCLGLEGQWGATAGNADLAAQLKKLLAEAVAPLSALDDKAAGIIAKQLPGAPATQPATRPFGKGP